MVKKGVLYPGSREHLFLIPSITLEITEIQLRKLADISDYDINHKYL
jgi:hypothetical protein